MKEITTMISRHPIFQGLHPRHMEILAKHASRVTFEPDQIIFREGEVAWQCYLILKGKVGLEAYLPHNGHILMHQINAGEMVGWSWLFQPYQWHFQARALEPTEAVFLDGSCLLIASEKDHDFGYELMKRISQVLIHRFETTRQRFLDSEEAASVEL